MVQPSEWTRNWPDDALSNSTFTEARTVNDKRTRSEEPLQNKERMVLSSRIAAIRIVFDDELAGKPGYVVQLQPGSQIALCGAGFDKKTVKISFDGHFYFVFRFDISGLK